MGWDSEQMHVLGLLDLGADDLCWLIYRRW